MKRYPEFNNVSQPALIRAAREAVAGALAGDFPVDPLTGPELSRALSCIASVVKRHGTLIEMGIACALRMNGFIVLPNAELPLTKGAKQLLDARNSDRSLARIKLSADSEADSRVNVDLIVVDPDAGWAGVYEVKRGNGVTETNKRHLTLRRLKAARLVLASYLQEREYGPIETTTSGVIDYFGGSGFDPDLTVTRDQLDDHFGVPVLATVEAVTAAAREALDAELPALFEPVFDRMTLPTDAAAILPNPWTTTGGRIRRAARSVPIETMAAPVGPGKRRVRNVPVRH